MLTNERQRARKGRPFDRYTAPPAKRTLPQDGPAPSGWPQEECPGDTTGPYRWRSLPLR